MYVTPAGGRIFLSGNGHHQGVGICISATFGKLLSDCKFHAYSNRVCTLHFTLLKKTFCVFSCYFPTTWHDDEDVEEIYHLLDTLLIACGECGTIPILGGDFNACIGMANWEADEFIRHIGPCGMGTRNVRGTILARWVCQQSLYIFNRDETVDQHDTWTCRRCFDGALVQIDFIIGDSRAIFEKGWCDNDFPIGNDHRAVHCILGFRLSKVLACKRVKSLKSWRPNLDENGEATEYKTLLVASIPTLQPFTFNAAETLLLQTAAKTGTCTAKGRKFIPSAQLQQLRANRRTTQDGGIRRALTFQIHRLHRVEVRKWKSMNLAQHLHNPSQWNSLRGMHLCTGSRTMLQPPVNEFANMLESLFAGNPSDPQQPDVMTEPEWTPCELANAIQKLKLDKAVDEYGLAAEMLKHLPDVYLQKLLNLYNHVLCNGEVPSSWRRTMFFFSPAPFCRRISVLDCCTGQSPGKGNELTVVLVSLQATK